MGHYDDDYAWTAQEKQNHKNKQLLADIIEQLKAVSKCVDTLQYNHKNIDPYHYRVLIDLYNDLKVQEQTTYEKIQPYLPSKRNK